jgi:hypothetical protein
MKLVVDKASLVSVADAIREKGNTTDELEFPNGFVDAVNAIESGGGGTEEIENIIDESGVLGTTDETVTVSDKVEQLIDEMKNYNFYKENLRSIRFQNNKNITEIPVIDCINMTDLTMAFYSCNNRSFKTVSLKNTQNVIVWKEFIHNTFIETIGVLNLSGAVNASSYYSMFSGNNSLTNLEIVPETIKYSITIPSPVLSDESIESILKGLAPVETTQLLSVNIKVLDRILDDKFFDLVSEVVDKGWEIS